MAIKSPHIEPELKNMAKPDRTTYDDTEDSLNNLKGAIILNRMNNCGCNSDPAFDSDIRNTGDCNYTGLSALPENPVVAMAYIPFQTDRKVYDAETALCNGTLFPVLNKPFLGACRK